MRTKPPVRIGRHFLFGLDTRVEFIIILPRCLTGEAWEGDFIVPRTAFSQNPNLVGGTVLHFPNTKWLFSCN